MTKIKYETEFKKRIAISNAQVKTKKCGGHVQIIQPVKTKNNIPFLYNERKVKTLKTYLESSEPQIIIPNSYIMNTLSQEKAAQRELSQKSPYVYLSPMSTYRALEEAKESFSGQAE